MATPLRVGLIGAGGIARAHLAAYQRFPEQVRLAAVCDVDGAAAERLAAEAGGAPVYRDAARLLREAAVDAVDICTPHHEHAPLALAAISAGRHVLVEKPMACSLAEARAMTEAAARAGVTLMVAQNQRYMPSYRGVRRLIQAGELGAIRAARFDAMQNLAAFLPAGHWLYDGARAGGGIVISVAVHRIDLLRYLIGDVVAVTAVCRTTRPEFVNGAEDYACATLEFAGGAIGEMFATYSGFRMPWSEQFMIFGETGAIHAVPPIGQYHGPAMAATQRSGPPGEGWAQQFGGFAPVTPDDDGLPGDDSIVNEILHFAACCRSGAEPLSSGRDNLGTMRVIAGIYAAAREGRRVELAALD